MTNIESLRRQLEAHRDALEKRIAALGDNLRAPLEADSEEQAANLADDEPMEALEAAAHRTIAHINAALARMDSGDYGICAACGEDIAPARLDAMPEAILCMNCAARA